MATEKRLNRREADEYSASLAVLIDADNAQAKFIEGILAEVARFGEATVKRIYGDFTVIPPFLAALGSRAMRP